MFLYPHGYLISHVVTERRISSELNQPYYVNIFFLRTSHERWKEIFSSLIIFFNSLIGQPLSKDVQQGNSKLPFFFFFFCTFYLHSEMRDSPSCLAAHVTQVCSYYV